jgi:hypothetical protein
MKHISDEILLNLISNKLSEQETALWLKHTEQCSICKLRVQQMQITWDQLGKWELTIPETNLSSTILARLDNTIEPNTSKTIKFLDKHALLRLAASVIIGLSTGFLTHHIMPTNQPSIEQQLSDSIYMDMLMLNSATGLGDSILQTVSANEVN